MDQLLEQMKAQLHELLRLRTQAMSLEELAGAYAGEVLKAVNAHDPA